jgi:dipeptidyl aminopeptidase/acylaminoacyl peptidase
MKTILLLVSVILVVLLLPVVFKDKGTSPVVGPDLAELEYSEISFENNHADIQLAGMLFLPDGEGPFPTAVMIQGSGPSKRDRIWYLSVAEHLQSNGIAVLLPDKRGCEKSGGNWVGADFEELATDTINAIEFVEKQQMFEYSRIGIIGMSQGGWIASVVAAQTNDLSFVVSMSGGSVTTDEQLLYEETNNIAPYTYTFIAKLIAPIMTNNLKQLDSVSAFMGFDPIPYWENVNVPVFFAFGDNDPNVPADTSVERLRETNLNQVKVKTYPGGEHGIIDPQTYELSPEYLDDLVRFINES